MNARIRGAISEATGPSFDERCRAASREYAKRTKLVEDAQKRIIDEALARAKLRPCASSARTSDKKPASMEERYKINSEARKEREREFGKAMRESQRKMDAREPLFRVSEVEAAFEMQRQRQAQHKKDLRDDEARMWEHIQGLQAKVVERPMLIEDYHRPVHQRSVPNMRLIPNHTKETPLEASIVKAVSQKWFKESAWGSEVATLREKMDNRPKLHEIKYPPKVFAKKPLGPRALMPIEVQMHAAVSQSWFQKSQWAEHVRDLKQKMDDRPKLHEISYPPKP